MSIYCEIINKKVDLYNNCFNYLVILINATIKIMQLEKKDTILIL